MSFDAKHVQATLGMRYGNIRKIGAGGKAAVFSAYDAVLKRSVAVKLLSEPDNSDRQVVRFQREAKLASRLKHPNIITVMDFGVGENGNLYLIMDLVEGSSLDELVKESGPMSIGDALPVFIQICEALSHSHEQGVVHRDLKPSNIMIASEEGKYSNVRIVDFGLAKVVEEDQNLTKTGQAIGTPFYSSPEQIQSRSIDARSDIYSLGCVMFFVLTGKPPFVGENAIETYDMHINTPVPNLIEFGCKDGESDEIHRIIESSLKKDPEERIPSARQLKAELVELLPEDTKAAVHEAEEKYVKSQKTSISILRQHKIAIAVCGLIVCIIGLLGFDRFEKRKPPQAKPAILENDLMSQDPSRWHFYCRERYGLPTWINIDCRMSDQHFTQLKGKNIKAVSLYAMRLEGWGLKYLKNEPIESLSVAESKIIDENLHYIGDLKTLVKLDISYTWITDDGVNTISELPKLKKLGMAGCTKLTHKSIDYVNRFAPELEELNISLTPVGVEGYEKLMNLSKLKKLDISLSKLTDESIAPIFKIQNLKQLVISKNKKLTDETLSNLKEMPALRYLKLDQCSGFSKEGLEAFKKAKPKCQVVTKTKSRGLGKKKILFFGSLEDTQKNKNSR